MQADLIGKGISNRRKQLGLSQEELAGVIGVTRQAVSRWESGTALPSVDNMIELSRALKVSVDELLQLTEQPQDSGLSAQSVGLLLDEYAARQEKRIKRLTIALVVAAVILALGIAISISVGLLQSSRMEGKLNSMITTTNSQLSSAISSLNARISDTIQEAVSDGNTHLTDSGYRTEYDHASRAFIVHLYACPQSLGAYSDAVFSLLLADNTRLTAVAQMVNGRFEGSIRIPDAGQERISGSAYVSWQQDGEIITETIKFYDIHTCFDRLVITSAWMDTSSRLDESIAVRPWATVFLCYDAPDTYPVSIRYDIYANGELVTSLTEEWPVRQARTSADFSANTVTHSAAEYTPLEGITSADGLLLRVTVTDALGREFTKDYTPEYP